MLSLLDCGRDARRCPVGGRRAAAPPPTWAVPAGPMRQAGRSQTQLRLHSLSSNSPWAPVGDKRSGNPLAPASHSEVHSSIERAVQAMPMTALAQRAAGLAGPARGRLERQTLPASPAALSGSQAAARRSKQRSAVAASASSNPAAAAAAAATPAAAPAQAQGEREVPGRPGVYEGWWTWQGHRIRYQRAGEAGPPVLCIHGFGASADHWRRNLPALGAGGFRAYAIDLLGYGYSDKVRSG